MARRRVSQGAHLRATGRPYIPPEHKAPAWWMAAFYAGVVLVAVAVAPWIFGGLVFLAAVLFILWVVWRAVSH